MKNMKEEIIKLRKEGKTYNEIKEILNCSKGTISYHCSKLEENEKNTTMNNLSKNVCQIKNDKYLPCVETIRNIFDLRKKKMTYKEISKELNINIDIIARVCRKLKTVEVRKRCKINNETIDKINILYNELKNIKKVAKILNISRDSVRKYVKIKEKLSEEELKNNRVNQVIEWRRRAKLKLIEYKGGKCEKCGYDRCNDALEFHHIDPYEKDFTISGKCWSLERLKKESDKCMLLCSNCHKEIHYEIKNATMT